MVDWTAPTTVTQAQRDAAMAYGVALKPWTEPADQQFRAIQVARLAAHFPAKNRPPGHDRVLAADFDRLLGDLPPDILADAVDACVRTLKFMPTIAEIRKEASREFGRRLMLRYRLRRVCQARVAEPLNLSAEQMAERRAFAENLMAKYRTGARV